MKKTKTKKTTKKSIKPKKHRHQHYESHYLAIALIALLLIETCFLTTTSTLDWQKGLSVLDISDSVSQTISDTATVFQPIADVVVGVNEFYKLSAAALAQLLDISDSDPIGDLSIVTDGVYDFYQQASDQLAQLLDFSETSSWPARVAGVSIVTQ